MKNLLILCSSLALWACGGPSKAESTAMTNPCGDNPCGDNPCGDNPCGDNPCGENPCADNPCGENPCGESVQAPAVDWSTWQSWNKVNAKPFVSKGHKKPWVNVYVPPQFAATYAALDTEMPEGFAVVKSVHEDVKGAAGKVAMLTVMAKMGADYDPDNGNWYYGVLSADGAKVIKEGKLDACMGCHSSGKDYLFGTK